jgi:hypothetical protein
MKAGAETKAGQVMADGPFRYLRNPLYVGSLLMKATIAILMPPSGALVSLTLLTIFVFRLILGEEAFLAGQLGAPYAAYCRAVPRLIPTLRPGVASGGQRPRWALALLSELTPVGVLVSFAALSWQYNAELLTRAVMISFGASLVVRALIAKRAEPSPVA